MISVPLSIFLSTAIGIGSMKFELLFYGTFSDFYSVFTLLRVLFSAYFAFFYSAYLKAFFSAYLIAYNSAYLFFIYLASLSAFSPAYFSAISSANLKAFLSAYLIDYISASL